jgi:hypothetical protein
MIGPLPTPRVSPKLSMGDIMEKAKVHFVSDCPSSRMILSRPTMFHRETIFL